MMFWMAAFACDVFICFVFMSNLGVAAAVVAPLAFTCIQQRPTVLFAGNMREGVGQIRSNLQFFLGRKWDPASLGAVQGRRREWDPASRRGYAGRAGLARTDEGGWGKWTK